MATGSKVGSENVVVSSTSISNSGMNRIRHPRKKAKNSTDKLVAPKYKQMSRMVIGRTVNKSGTMRKEVNTPK